METVKMTEVRQHGKQEFTYLTFGLALVLHLTLQLLDSVLVLARLLTLSI
jgi:hypothetical protein